MNSKYWEERKQFIELFYGLYSFAHPDKINQLCRVIYGASSPTLLDLGELQKLYEVLKNEKRNQDHP